jgi:hypothetical protein
MGIDPFVLEKNTMDQETKSIPTITLTEWPTMAIPKVELQNILTYLAYKTNKPVTFDRYKEDEGYSADSVSVRIAVNDNTRELDGQMPVHLCDKVYELSDQQVIV